jgi:hypothetical protein
MAQGQGVVTPMSTVDRRRIAGMVATRLEIDPETGCVFVIATDPHGVEWEIPTDQWVGPFTASVPVPEPTSPGVAVLPG